MCTPRSGRPPRAPAHAQRRRPHRRPDARAGRGRPPRPRAAAAGGRAGRGQDPHADAPRRVPAGHGPRSGVADPRRHVQRQGGRRAAPATHRPARRASGSRRHRGDVSLGVRADPARARRRVRAHRRLHDLRPGRRAARDRVAAVRPPASRDPAGARGLRAPAGRRSRAPDQPGQEPAATPEAYERSARRSAAGLVAAVWRACDAELERSNAFGFDDLLACAVRLLAEHPHRLAHLRSRWRWLVVDEMQDTNEAQAALLHLLAGPDGNVTCTGDDDQGDLPLPVRRAAQHPALRRALPGAPADRAGAQLPLARGDRARRRRVHRATTRTEAPRR